MKAPVRYYRSPNFPSVDTEQGWKDEYSRSSDETRLRMFGKNWYERMEEVVPAVDHADRMETSEWLPIKENFPKYVRIALVPAIGIDDSIYGGMEYIATFDKESMDRLVDEGVIDEPSSEIEAMRIEFVANNQNVSDFWSAIYKGKDGKNYTVYGASYPYLSCMQNG